MTYLLGEGKYVGYLKTEEGIRAQVFRTGKGCVAVAWSEKDPGTLNLKSSSDLKIWDLMGGESTAVSSDGRVSVSVSGAPVYIKLNTLPDSFVAVDYPESKAVSTVCSTDYTAAQRVIAVPEFKEIDYVNEKVKGHKIEDGTQLIIRLTNLNEQAVTGSVSVEIDGFTVVFEDEGPVTVPAMSEIKVRATLRKGAGTPGNLLTVRGSFEGGETTPAVCQVYSES